MNGMMTITGAGQVWYTIDNSGLLPRVCQIFTSQRLAQRSLLNTRDALAFDQGASFASVAPTQGEI
jgi:hypothetical protein